MATLIDGNIVLTSVVTLLAVGLGAWLSLIGQSRAASRQGSQRWREARIATYGRFLGAVRGYVTYIRQTSEIAAVPHADRVHSIPLLGAEGMQYVEAIEAALAEVRLVARFEETAKLAVALVVAVDRMAGAKSKLGPGQMPDQELLVFRTAQSSFIAEARRELKAGDRSA